MSIWERIAEALRALAAGDSLSDIFERLRTPPERSVAFTIAVISLAAKMAKADGRVTRDEVRAFREVFSIPKADEAAAARVFNLARQDVAGFDTYAARIGQMFRGNREVLENLLEGLFHVATADGHYHDAEDRFLFEVSGAFGLTESCFRTIRARYVPDAEQDPRAVLGLPPDASYEDARRTWRKLVRETHPDHLLAQGLPEEAIKLANRRLAVINHAWEQIQSAERV
ncbi:molecular chaperone DjiA [Oceanibium sediminis]|uniref:molecular chaperone DjiA n=1 Tax=Oceanibium sediminis TaxID=2026339 RepID=UPI000DD39D38|nr:molecular chaperone DjiA [Oceanibium sediminis]